MPIEFRCSECNKLLRTNDGTAGQQAKCPECGEIQMIPAPDNASQQGPQPPGAADDGTPFGESPFETPGTSQPWGDSPGVENPYQSPQAGMSVPGMIPQSAADLRAYALGRVSVPATMLVVFGSLAIPVAILGAIGNVFMFNLEGGGFPDPALQRFFQQGPAFMVGIQVVSAAVSVGIGILMIVGGLKMQKLEGRGLCLAAAIVALVPCFSPCCCLEVPVGIWALVVLVDSRVSAAFRQ